jgi:hypothetical protein
VRSRHWRRIRSCSGIFWRCAIAADGAPEPSASAQRYWKLAHERLAAIDSRAVIEPVACRRRCSEATLKLEDGTALACHALLGSQSTPPQGISAEVIDLGRGSRRFRERAQATSRGRLVLVRHSIHFLRSMCIAGANTGGRWTPRGWFHHR